jgi:tripartite-type tricarboxylate transporter receptor subunit TctC
MRPARLPNDIAQTLNAAVVEALRTPDLRARFNTLSFETAARPRWASGGESAEEASHGTRHSPCDFRRLAHLRAA